MLKVTVHKKLKSPLTFNKSKFLTPCIFFIEKEDNEKLVKYFNKRGLEEMDYEISETNVVPEMITDEAMINSLMKSLEK